MPNEGRKKNERVRKRKREREKEIRDNRKEAKREKSGIMASARHCKSYLIMFRQVRDDGL